ncbi:ABC transporter ATP-binding protein [Trinickia fusca]|uniref:ATP-binding cassette domain-containing protein n=1 Tax=Trinickia fusca TaxID=2419777 RepID=A0A494XP84_9BURK|nr:ATP-binding cassette domain-containing protein [Trinickia fusca]RKP52465.1 ATP-binding cassette domain-containing protein [Trinickia fusca]
MTASFLLEARGIARRDTRSDTVLLEPTDFALAPGERVSVTGASGAGKSVLLRALALLDPLDSGHLVWHGQPVERRAIPRYRRHVAYLRQRPALFDGTVEDNLRYPYSLHAYHDVRFDRVQAVRLAEAAGRASSFLDKRANDLSGGEAQLTALIRVLQLSPEVLLLDEPTASLDPDAARAVEALVTAWFEAGQGARASVWVSHDPAQAARVSTRRLIMQAGRLSDSKQVQVTR